MALQAKVNPPTSTEILPSGIEVAYWDSIGPDGEPQERRYEVNGQRYPSISTIAGIYHKEALVPAAVKMQEEAIIRLSEHSDYDCGLPKQRQLRKALIKNGLHYDCIWEEARDRGSVVHDAMQGMAEAGSSAFVVSKVGDAFQHALAGSKFWIDHKPEPIDTEYMVASVRHGFVGRGDLFCKLKGGRKARVDYKTVSKWSYVWDEKRRRPTNKLRPPHDENLIALAGYELGAVESGYEPTEVQLIVRLGPDGNYDIYESPAGPEVFLASLAAYNARKELHEAMAA